MLVALKVVLEKLAVPENAQHLADLGVRPVKRKLVQKRLDHLQIGVRAGTKVCLLHARIGYQFETWHTSDKGRGSATCLSADTQRTGWLQGFGGVVVS